MADQIQTTEITNTPSVPQTSEQMRAVAAKAVEDKIAQQAVVPLPTEQTNYESKYTQAMVTVGKKDKEVRELKIQLEALQKQAQELDEWKTTLTKPVERLRFLEKQGVSYRDLVADAVASTDEPKTPEQKRIDDMQSKLTALEEQLTTARQEKEQATQQRVTQGYLQYAQQMVDNNPNQYPLTKAFNLSNRIVDEYAKRLKELGPNPPSVPDEAEVAQYVEDRIRTDLRQKLPLLIPTAPFAAMLAEHGYTQQVASAQTQQKPVPQAQSLGPQNQTQKSAAVTPTLTNDMSATTAHGLDYDELLRRGDKKALRDNAIRQADLRKR